MSDDLLIHKKFSNVASGFPQKTALQIKINSEWQRFTYKQLQDDVLKVGAFLIKEDLKKGDYLGLILENRPEWAIIYLGIMQAGLTCVPVDPQLSGSELENILNDCGAKIAFTSQTIFTKKFNGKLKANLKRLVVLELEREGDGVFDFSKIKNISAENIIWPDTSPEDVASLIYTSGTTAQPKGVILSHRNLCSNFKSLDNLKICLPSDNFLSILPLHHTYAFMVTLIIPLFTGATVTYCASFKPQDLSSIIKEASVTVLVGVPQLFSMLHKAIFDKLKKIPFILPPLTIPFMKNKVRNNLGRSIRLFISGGARLQPGIAKDLTKVGFKIVEGYGLTETSPVATLNPPKKIKFGSVGKPIPGVQIKIFNPDKFAVGEVLIKGPNVMRGYFKQPELTAQVITEEWFHSGDLGYLDKDGYLFLTGREKDVIVLSSGKNIYPEELEDCFFSQSPYIKEICILGTKDYKFAEETESLYAVVVPDLEYFRKNNVVNIRDKIRWEIDSISKKLPSYQHIMGFTIAKEELPRTPLKKIKRYQVRQLYLKEKIEAEESKEVGLSDDDRELFQTDLAQKVIDFLAKELKRKAYLSSHLEIDLGIDSLSRVELGLGLESLLKVKIPAGLIEKVFTVKELIISLEEISSQTKGVKQAGFAEEKKSWAEIIREKPSDKILDKIKLTSGLLDKLLTFIFKYGFYFLFRIFWLLRIKGREFIPKDKPYILCPNHASYLDGFLLFSSLPFNSARDLFFVGLAKIFNKPLIAWAIKVARLIPIDPVTHLTEAMQASSYVLSNKKVLCIFPEGSRSISEEVRDFKKGVGILAKELDVLIIPVYIQGSYYSWPRGSRFPRPYPLKIIFGKPLNWRDMGGDYVAIAKGLREGVLNLRKISG